MKPEINKAATVHAAGLRLARKCFPFFCALLLSAFVLTWIRESGNDMESISTPEEWAIIRDGC